MRWADALGRPSWRQYGQSKFANILFAKALAHRFEGSQRTANSLHPGIIETNLARHNWIARIFYALIRHLVPKSIPQGASTQVYLATNPALAGVSGKYFADCNLAKPRSDTQDALAAERLWQVSEQIAAEV